MSKPILLVGSHRSGSTWIGRMLSLPYQVKYISEPFNPTTGLKIFTNWFQYINDRNEDKYFVEIKKMMDFKGDFSLNLPALKYWSNNFLPFKKRPLIKDPIASFSAGWLAKKFDIQVVVIVRHPAAFYYSLKRMNWHFDFDNFLNQPDLMRDYLHKFDDLIKKRNKSYPESVAILWLCINYILTEYIKRHPDWIVKRHEDISLNPVDEFHDLYNRLNLPFDKKIERKIKKYSSQNNPINTKKDQAIDLRRNSQSLIKDWKKHLDEEEVEIIKKITKPVSNKYYSQKDW